MGIHLLTFAGDYHGDTYTSAANNLKKWAEEFNLFSSITIINPNILFQDYEFFQRHINYIIKNKRGFGYWVWKPYIILKKLQELKEGDLLLYMDACCFLNIKAKEKFLHYVDLANKNPDGNLFFEYSQIISNWCKMDLIEHLDAKNIMNEREIMPGVAFIRVNEKMINFYKKFYEIACNYHLIDDTPSISPNTPTFREHRHDQSIFSILVRKYCPLSISTSVFTSDMYFYKREKEGINYPIWIHSNNHYGYNGFKLI